MTIPIVIGTRGSDLALRQAAYAKGLMEKIGCACEIKIIHTKGDHAKDVSLDQVEGTGFFTKEIEEALLRKEIDLAVHSFKDLPTQVTKGLEVGAMPVREDPSELIISVPHAVDRSLPLFLKKNAVVGTSSPRRKCQILAFRPDLQLADLRGNVPTRIRRVREGKYDAVLVASAGVRRLEADLTGLIAETLPPRLFIPAPAQGSLAFQVRADDAELKKIISGMNDPEAFRLVSAEREVLHLLQGGCRLPAGAYCKKERDLYFMWAVYAADWRRFPRRACVSSADPGTLPGIVLKKISEDVTGQRVFITRNPDAGSYFFRSMHACGISVSGCSLIEFTPVPVRELPGCDWVFFSSRHAVKYFFKQEMHKLLPNLNARYAALGGGTSAELASWRVMADFTGDDPDPHRIAETFLEKAAGKRVLFPRAADSLRSVQQALGDRVHALDVVVYENRPAENVKLPDADVAALTSPMNAEAFLRLSKGKKMKYVVIGRSTAKTLERAGIQDYRVAFYPDEVSLADAVMEIVSPDAA